MKEDKYMDNETRKAIAGLLIIVAFLCVAFALWFVWKPLSFVWLAFIIAYSAVKLGTEAEK